MKLSLAIAQPDFFLGIMSIEPKHGITGRAISKALLLSIA
jgi:hypothetical protein